MRRRIESDKPVYTRKHAANDAVAAISWPAHPPHSPVCPNRTKDRSLWPGLASSNLVVLQDCSRIAIQEVLRAFLWLPASAGIHTDLHR